MTLINNGFFPDTYWASRYWPEDYWPEYGTSITGGDSARYYYMKKILPKGNTELYQTLKTLLETIKGEQKN